MRCLHWRHSLPLGSILTAVALSLLGNGPAFACTLLKVSDGQRVLFGNNEDWSDPDTHVWVQPRTAGSFGAVCFGFGNYFPQGGMNERGLCWDWLAWGQRPWSADPAKRTLARAAALVMMETCATVDEAIAFYQQTNDSNFGYATILIADRLGNSAQIGFRNGAFFIDRGGPAQVIGYGAETVNRLLAVNHDVSVENVATLLDQGRQYGTYPTQYSFIADPIAGALYVYDFRRSPVPVKLDVAAELARGSRAFTMPLSAAQLGYPITDPADATPAPAPSDTRLVNLSARGLSGSNDQILIVGFVLEGAETHPVLARGIGPGLRECGVTGYLADPELWLYCGADVSAHSDDWHGSADLRRACVATGAFQIDGASLDAAIAAPLPCRSHTLHLTTRGASARVGMVEIYDANPSVPGFLRNVSARGYVGTDEGALVGGFVVAGPDFARVLIRGIGPSLSSWVAGALPSAEIVLYSQRDGIVTELAANNGWGGSTELREAAERVGAFPIAPDSKDAALFVSLAAGNYTVHLRGQHDAVGIGLLELYQVR